tara:strand:- start:2167 stop:2424 length:258 start_codon:yes stop_codon:yes gene_type:complete
MKNSIVSLEVAGTRTMIESKSPAMRTLLEVLKKALNGHLSASPTITLPTQRTSAFRPHGHQHKMEISRHQINIQPFAMRRATYTM